MDTNTETLSGPATHSDDDALWPAEIRAALAAYPRLPVAPDFNQRVMQRLEARPPTLLARIDALFARPIPKLLGAFGLGTLMTTPALAFIGYVALSQRSPTPSAPEPSRVAAVRPLPTRNSNSPTVPSRGETSRRQMLARLLREAEDDPAKSLPSVPPADSQSPSAVPLAVPLTQPSRSSGSRSSSCPSRDGSLA